MADHFLQNITQSFSLWDIDLSIQFLNQFSGPNPYCNSLIGLSEGPGNLENFPGLFAIPDERTALTSFSFANSFAYSSPQGSDHGIKKTKRNRAERGKKVKSSNKKEDAKLREVVHVRAKRGQATHSHSLAERVRRKKINDRLRCLQDIVPGCHQTMGMTVMLDEIINYLQSLQSQVEFLSMRLNASSVFYDFKSDADAMETMQSPTERKNENFPVFSANTASPGVPNSAQFAPLGLNLGYYCPELPHSL